MNYHLVSYINYQSLVIFLILFPIKLKCLLIMSVPHLSLRYLRLQHVICLAKRLLSIAGY